MRKGFCLACILSLLLCLSGCEQQAGWRQLAREENTVVTVLFGESTTDPGVADMLIERIRVAYPEVTLEWETMDWGEQFSARLSAKIASGEVPDLIIGKAQDVHSFAPTGALGILPDALRELVSPLGYASTAIGDALYGLTYNQLYQGVLYNKNIFYRYNLTPPRTTEELAAIVERLETMGITPFATHFQETWYTGNILMQFAIGEVFERTPDWGDQLRAQTVSFADSEAYRFCCEQVREHYLHSWPDALGISQAECDLRFAQEEAAMYLSGAWSVQMLQATAPYRQIGIFPYPNRSGDARLISEPNITFMKSATTQHDALLDDMLAMIFSDAELAQAICAFTQTDSTLIGVDTSGTLQMIREDIDAYQAAGAVVSAAVGNDQLVWSYQYACAQSLLGYLEGTQTLDAVLARWDETRAESSRMP